MDTLFRPISCDYVTIVLSDDLYDDAWRAAYITGYKDDKVVGYHFSDSYTIKGCVEGDFEVENGGLKLWSAKRNNGSLKVQFGSCTVIEG